MSEQDENLKAIAQQLTKTEDRADDHLTKILYYNAFTEDLFYWDKLLFENLMDNYGYWQKEVQNG